MKLFIMEGVCLTRGKETSVVSCILGFRNQNKSVDFNSKKGGPVCL